MILIPPALAMKRCTTVIGPNFVSMSPAVSIGVPGWLAIDDPAAADATTACSAAGREGGDDGEEASALLVSRFKGVREGLVGDY